MGSACRIPVKTDTCWSEPKYLGSKPSGSDWTPQEESKSLTSGWATAESHHQSQQGRTDVCSIKKKFFTQRGKDFSKLQSLKRKKWCPQLIMYSNTMIHEKTCLKRCPHLVKFFRWAFVHPKLRNRIKERLQMPQLPIMMQHAHEAKQTFTEKRWW